MRGSAFEAPDCRRQSKTIWQSIAKSPSSGNLSWENVLYYLDRSKKIFPARVMQDYTSPDDKAMMGVHEKIEHLLAGTLKAHKGETSRDIN